MTLMTSYIDVVVLKTLKWLNGANRLDLILIRFGYVLSPLVHNLKGKEHKNINEV